MEHPLLKSHPYLHVGNAYELEGADHRFYRFLEIMPGFLSLLTLLGIVVLSFVAPKYAAYFTILFALYWFLKTVYLSAHLQHNFKRLKHNMAVNWTAMLVEAPKSDDIVHLVLFPCYREGYEVIYASIDACRKAEGDSKKIAIVLALEERTVADQMPIAERIKEEFKDDFFEFLITVHPRHLDGEIPGKGSNISYAAEEARKLILDQKNLSYHRVIVSAFDIDTVVYPKYFTCLTWHFVTAPRPENVSFQPVPLYNNNIWEAPMISRVLAYSSTFWQMIQQERPEKLATFSSHALSFQALYDVGYWQKNIVSEDSRIFWNLFIAHDGDYEVIPLSYPVSMDANVAPKIWTTVKNLYKQHRRWTWGVENVPYILFNFRKTPKIPFTKKFRAAFVQIEGFWSLVTNPLILFIVGWLPLLVGGHAFNTTVLSYNLPIMARFILTLAMSGLIVSAAISMALIPERPKELGWRRSVLMLLQWILVPFTMIVFSAIPGLDAQIRLLTARYMGFWVTPKSR